MVQHDGIQPVLNRFQNQVNRVMEDVIPEAQISGSRTAEWSPHVDVLEYDDRFELYADMPGVGTHAIDISLENNILTVTGERTKLALAEEKPRVRLERPAGKFHRQFILPNVADTDDITANNKDGVLQIIIKKREEAKRRKIEVLKAH